MSKTHRSPLAQALAKIPALPRISELSDTRVEAWRKLGDSAPSRREHGLFLVEGLRACELLFADAVYPVAELIVVAEELLHRQKETQASAAQVVRQAAKAEVSVFDVTREVFRRIAGVNKVRGVLAVVRKPEWSMENLVAGLAEQQGLAIATVGLNDPGNLGTLMRTGYAFGAQALFALEGSTDPFHPKVLRASAGHLLRAVKGTWQEFRHACSSHGVDVLGLLPSPPEGEGLGVRATVALDELARDPTKAVVVCVGSEGAGFPEHVRDFDRTVAIPMRPGAESLNAGVAGSLVLWKLRKV